MIEEKTSEVLTDTIEIVRVDLPYYVKKCYNLGDEELDYKDKFIGIIGIEDKRLLKSLTKGDRNMEEIVDKVEEFSEDEEILGAYDGEWHRREVARVVMLDKIEKAEEQGIEQGSIKEKNTIALNMLKENIDIKLISKVTGLNIDQIKKLRK